MAKAEPIGFATGMADHRIDATAPLWTNLGSALLAAREPSLNVRLDTYQPAFFNLSAVVLIDPRYRWPDVEASIRSALGEAFAFERRSFVLDVDRAVLDRVRRPFPVEPIRTTDAVHLAPAELLGEAPPLLTIGTRDERVRKNAEARGYNVE